jgi:hypothetical protein
MTADLCTVMSKDFAILDRSKTVTRVGIHFKVMFVSVCSAVAVSCESCVLHQGVHSLV